MTPLVILLDGEGDVSWNYLTACKQLAETKGAESALSFAYLLGRNENAAGGDPVWMNVFEKTASEMGMSINWDGLKRKITEGQG